MPATLGIDASLCTTGIHYLNGNVSTSYYLPEPKLRHAKRLFSLKTRFMDVLDGLRHIDLAAIEGYSYNSTGRRFELGEWGGIIKTELFARGIPFVIIPPLNLKRFMGVKRPDKSLIIKAVAEQYRFDAQGNSDIADACVLAHIAEVCLTGASSIRVQLEVVQTALATLESP